ncbi:uncharacterized protein LTR77_007994 [Saxophila tyrrhenica]|uniref:Fungal N-terminal domain-containing protein n=1 Tax=Saxophila tyrrhenica TaxID=1690608 RepID=A0AAV9P4C3_9PEZI|nr:hypothetical protein LTR77_007994 [Saxophila tyrrhenica]
MAEIFGAVAGGAGLVSLAVQLADCAVKLKSFCEQVEKAPRSLRRISRELNTLSLLLRQIDGLRIEHGSRDADALEECIELCRESTEDIVEATTSLEAVLARFRLAGRLYSALRMGDIKQLCADLERSKNSLMLAFQVFDHRTQVRMMHASNDREIQHGLALLKLGGAVSEIRSDIAMSSLQAAPPGAARRQLESSIPQVTDVVNTDLVRRPARSAPRRVPAGKKGTTYRFKLPSWFCDRVWLLSTCRAQGDWTLRLQTFRIRPYRDSPIVMYLRAGNVSMVRKMFDEGTASPYDMYDRGNCWVMSPLQIAAGSGSVELCNLLLIPGFPDRVEAIRAAFAELSVTVFNSYNPEVTVGERLIAQRFIEAGDITLACDRETFGPNLGWWCHVQFLDLVKQNTIFDAPFDAQSRFDYLVINCCWTVDPGMLTKEFKLSGSEDSLASLRTSRPSSQGISVLHLIASKMTEEQRLSPRARKVIWTPLLEKLLTVGADLHPTTSVNIWCWPHDWPPQHEGHILQVFKTWISALFHANVDLTQYGKTEALAWPKALVHCHRYRNDWRPDVTFRICGFTYGATPAEWSLMVQACQTFYLYIMQTAPGGWETSPYVPQAICWEPESCDTVDGTTWSKSHVAFEICRPHQLSKPWEFYPGRRSSRDDTDRCETWTPLRLLEPTLRRPRHRRRASEPVRVVSAHLPQTRESGSDWEWAHRIHLHYAEYDIYYCDLNMLRMNACWFRCWNTHVDEWIRLRQATCKA